MVIGFYWAQSVELVVVKSPVVMVVVSKCYIRDVEQLLFASGYTNLLY